MKKNLVFLLIILGSIFISPPMLVAKLLVANPSQMIQHADLIIVGSVQAKHYTEDDREVIIKIESVLKGSTPLEEIALKQHKGPMYGWLGFDFPDQGKRVMVLLREGEKGKGYQLLNDLNNVATVEDNGDIKLYKGSTINETKPQDYEKAFKSIFDEYSRNISDVKAKEKRPETAAQDNIGNLTLLAILGGFIIVLVVIIKVRGRGGNAG